MNLQQYIEPKLLILIPVMIIGNGHKKSKYKYIPLLLGVISVVLAALWVFTANDLKSAREILSALFTAVKSAESISRSEEHALFTAVTQGILAAGASVYVSQLYIQLEKNE
mgnify:CR=1 FL=1